MRILLVEDDFFLSRAYEVSLRSSGFAVFTAADGRAGWVAACALLPDAILLDVLMPELSGKEVLIRLKNNESTADIPVVILSNSCNAAEAKELIALGAVAYLPKTSINLAQLNRLLWSLGRSTATLAVSRTSRASTTGAL